MPMDVGDNASKKKAPAAKQRIQQLIEMRKQLKFKFKEIQSQIKKYYDSYYKNIFSY
jgi:conjugal transfer/entry exclusion protein